jgi:isopentenyl diphosphate isomerase/L-lactate dehydrogenase-like FMN-dependent dehydrogenase
MKEEIVRDMMLMGCASIRELSPRNLRFRPSQGVPQASPRGR